MRGRQHGGGRPRQQRRWRRVRSCGPASRGRRRGVRQRQRSLPPSAAGSRRPAARQPGNTQAHAVIYLERKRLLRASSRDLNSPNNPTGETKHAQLSRNGGRDSRQLSSGRQICGQNVNFFGSTVLKSEHNGWAAQ